MRNFLSRKVLFLPIIATLVLAGFSITSGALPGGGNQDCPAGTTLVAKYEFDGSSYTAESGGDVVTISNGDENGGDFTSTVPIAAVVVKGSTDAKIDTYDPPVTSGSFDNSGLSTPGPTPNTPGVSNVKFCTGEGAETPPPNEEEVIPPPTAVVVQPNTTG